MLSWFKKSSAPAVSLTTDVHSHLLPGLDDGVKSFEEAEEIIRMFQHLGYTKLITTPHIIQDSFRNTPTTIYAKLKELNQYLRENKISVTVQAAAEYYLDENLMHLLQVDQPLLTFGQQLLLFETNFLNEPLNLKEFIFIANTKGYKPVLAHPERYLYLQNNLTKIEDLIQRGVLLQINIGSLGGLYSKPVQVTAQKLIDKGWVHLLGSDCHHQEHVKLIEKIKRNRYFQKALTLPLLNNSL